MKSMYGKETNRLFRQTYGVTWTGGWDNGVTSNSYAQYEHTRNSRMDEGLAGGTEGSSPVASFQISIWPMSCYIVK